MNLWLIGMPGSGKSAVGAPAAALAGTRFVDLDQEVEERAGRSIEMIWKAEGERGFRRRESAALRDVAEHSDQIVATGGGVVLDPASVSRMRGSGLVVWLDTPVQVLVERLMASPSRPVLEEPDEGRLAALESLRRPLYRGAAHVTLSTKGVSAQSLAGGVRDLWTSQST